MIAFLFLLALLTPPDPHLTAVWASPSAAVVSWEQQSRACLYHESQGGTQTFVGCYDGAGRATVEFGKVGPMDGALRPKAGDWYVAQIDGVTYRARLRGVVWLAIVRT